MLFDTLVKNGRSYTESINMVFEKCDEAFDYYMTSYKAECAKETYMDDYTSEGFIYTKKEEDYLIQNTEASPGIVGRLVRIIQEAWENLIRWIKAVTEKIKASFIKQEVKRKIGLFEKILSKFPKLKNQKVTIVDPKPKFLEKLGNDIQMLKIKLKTGKSIAEIKRENEELANRQRFHEKAKKVAVITVSVIAALVLLKQYMDFRTLNQPLVDKNNQDIFNNPNIKNNPERLMEGCNTAKVQNYYEKSRHFNIFMFLKSTPKILFNTVNGVKDSNKDGKMTKEISGLWGGTKLPNDGKKTSKGGGDNLTQAQLDDAMARMAKEFNLNDNQEEMGTSNPVDGVSQTGKKLDFDGTEIDLDNSPEV